MTPPITLNIMVGRADQGGDGEALTLFILYLKKNKEASDYKGNLGLQ